MKPLLLSVTGRVYDTEEDCTYEESAVDDTGDLDHLYSVLACYQQKLIKFPHIVEHMQAIMDEIGDL